LVRYRTASAYVDVAGSVLQEPPADEYLSVAAGLAVLAGIAASDVICGTSLKKTHRGDDHRGATALLETATADGRALSRTLGRLLDLKDEAHYGVYFVSKTKASQVVRWAKVLVERAEGELAR
jgi:hypothetical protein